MRLKYLFIISMIAALLTACSRGVNSPPTSTGVPSSNANVPANNAVNNSPAVTDVGGARNAKADIEKAAALLLEQKKFRVRLLGEGVNPSEMYLEYAAPDRYKLINLIPNGKTMETVIIGDKTYVNVAGKVMEAPTFDRNAIPFLRDLLAKDKLNEIKDLKFEREEVADGKEAFLYTYSAPKADGSGSYNARMWIAKDNGLPVRSVFEYPSGIFTKMEISMDYDSDVVIEVPKK